MATLKEIWPLRIQPTQFFSHFGKQNEGNIYINILVDNRNQNRYGEGLNNILWDGFMEHLAVCFNGFPYFYQSNVFTNMADVKGTDINYLFSTTENIPTIVLKPGFSDGKLKINVDTWGMGTPRRTVFFEFPLTERAIKIARKKIEERGNYLKSVQINDEIYEEYKRLFDIADKSNLTLEELIRNHHFDKLTNFVAFDKANYIQRDVYTELFNLLEHEIFVPIGVLLDVFFINEYGYAPRLPFILKRSGLSPEDCEKQLLAYVTNLGKDILSGQGMIGKEQLEEFKKNIENAGFIEDNELNNALNDLSKLFEVKALVDARPESVKAISQPEPGERKVFVVNGVAFVFRWCPPGEFIMGSLKNEEGRYNDEIPHRVTLTKGFWMMETPVTVAMFKTFVSDTGYESKGNTPGFYNGSVWEDNPSISWNNPGFRQDDDHPVTCVSWVDAIAFCKWLSNKTSENIHLPTESQWEYACRAGSTTAYSWGNALNGCSANCDGNYPCGTKVEGIFLNKTTPVGKYAPNALGLYDMHGNVCEWCADWFGDYPISSVIDPVGPSNGFERISRGGSWFSAARFCRSACRDSNVPGLRCYDLGFRCANGQ